MFKNIGTIFQMLNSVKWQIALTVTLLFLSSMSSNVWAQSLKVAVFADHFKVISTTFNNKGCVDTDQYVISDNQMLAEFMILCGALQQLEYDALELIPYPIVDRALEGLVKGEIDLIGFGVWQHDAIKYRLLLSEAILDRGEFTKGLYSTEDVIEKYSKSGTQYFEELIVVANKNWVHDWAALSCTGLNLLHVDRYQQMFSLVEKSRAEFVPLTFGSKPRLMRKEFGISLYPMPNMKIAFDQSLHFVVSPVSKEKEALLEVVNKGLSLFSESGKITRVYTRLGLINEKTKNWKVIGC